MKQLNSNLLNYVGLLLSDDAALKTFITDPITEAEGKYGITKAERAVLRRTVANLSNKSVNGFTMARHFGSYKRSLRLLQNVLHNVGSKMVQDTMLAAPSADSQLNGSYYFSVICYYPNVSSNVDCTDDTNLMVESQYGGPYANWSLSTVQLQNSNPTIQDVMNAAALPYTTVSSAQGIPYVKSLTPNGYEITADLSKYNLSDDFVFWFYSINGKAMPGNTGFSGESFAQFTLSPGDTVSWQLIAPDAEYGFYPCGPTEGNAYALSTSTPKKS